MGVLLNHMGTAHWRRRRPSMATSPSSSRWRVTTTCRIRPWQGSSISRSSRKRGPLPATPPCLGVILNSQSAWRVECRFIVKADDDVFVRTEVMHRYFKGLMEEYGPKSRSPSFSLSLPTLLSRSAFALVLPDALGGSRRAPAWWMVTARGGRGAGCTWGGWWRAPNRTATESGP